MIITFKELGIAARDYIGLTYEQAHALIVNQACDHLRMHQPYMSEEDFFPNIAQAFTNFIMETVEVQTMWDAAPTVGVLVH